MKQLWTHRDCKERSGRGLALVLACAFVLVAGRAQATPPIFGQFRAKYPDTPLLQAANTCMICHNTPAPARSWNPYGTALLDSTLSDIEGLDSDGDGHTNLKEITKGSLPGVSTSIPDDLPPVAGAKTPSNGATDVRIDALVTVTFDGLMKASSANANSFTLKAGGTPVTGAIILSGPTIIFAPAQPLSKGTTYTASITTELQDLAGNPLPQAETWGFTTGNASDTTAPSVSSNSPTGDATGVSALSLVSAIFSETVSNTTVNTSTFTLKAGSETTSGTVTVNGAAVTFKPDVDLASETFYTATLSSEIKDLAGNKLGTNHSWSFTTVKDTVPPQVRSTTPANGGGVNPPNGKLTAVFSEPVNSTTVTSASFTVKNADGTPVAGTVSANRNIATFTPQSPWPQGGSFTATVSDSVTDRVGLKMRAPFSWSFTTLVDSDGDGASDQEDDFPSDATRATFESAKGTGKIGMDVTGNGAAKLTKVHSLADGDLTVPGAGKPIGYDFPDGVVFCDIKDIAVAATVTIKMTFPTPLAAGSRVYRVSKEDGFREFPGAVINGSTVTLVLVDGKAWDADEEENGLISYGMGIARPAAAQIVTNPPDNIKGSGGCSSSTPEGRPSGVAAYALLVFSLLLWARPRRAQVKA